MIKMSVSSVLSEIKSHPKLRELHPLKLDRWHRELVGLPEPIYMQYGCEELLEQVITGAVAVDRMVDLLGAKELPVTPQELAQRSIASFRWYVLAPSNELAAFQADWDKTSSSWKLKCQQDEQTTRSVTSLENAFEQSKSWAQEIPLPFHEEAPEAG